MSYPADPTWIKAPVSRSFGYLQGVGGVEHARRPKLIEMSKTMVVVSPTAVVSARRALETIARYFRRELHYDFVPYSATDKHGDCGFLWIDDALQYPLHAAVGGCMFRWMDWSDRSATWALSWVWVHPFYRGRGLLDRSWDDFRSVFAPFYVEPPLSLAMEYFLKDPERGFRPNDHWVKKLRIP